VSPDPDRRFLKQCHAVGDDFRLTVEFEQESHGLHLMRLLRERVLEDEIRERLGHRVAVSQAGPHVFLYAATQEHAEAAKEVVRQLLAQHHIHAQVLPLLRWHPVEERWEEASVELPRTPEEVETEHRRWEEHEAEEARELGYAEWEVRVDLPTHKDAIALAKRLNGAGIRPIVRRWKYLLIGAANDDEARGLAERLRAEAPQEASVTAEPSWTIIWELTAKNPFAMFSALGPGPRSLLLR
jgi:hypothetical protein